MTYTLVGTNTNATHLAVVISDDLSDVLDSATYVVDSATAVLSDGTSAGPVTVDVDAATLVWTGSLDAKESVTITYSVTVNPGTSGKFLNNVASGTAVPPVGPPINPPDVETEHPIPSPGFVIDKSADPASGTAVDPGAKITYTVTGTNTGQTVLDPVVLTDNMADVLNNAAYNDDAFATIDGENAAGVLAFDGENDTLTWTGSLGLDRPARCEDHLHGDGYEHGRHGA